MLHQYIVHSENIPRQIYVTLDLDNYHLFVSARKAIAHMLFRYDSQAGRLQQGDTVKIISNLSELQRLQKGHGGFLPQMVAVSEFKFWVVTVWITQLYFSKTNEILVTKDSIRDFVINKDAL